MENSEWNSSVVNLEWDVLVDTLLEVSGGLGGGGEVSSSSGSGNLSGKHCVVCFVW